eukprot:UN25240
MFAEFQRHFFFKMNLSKFHDTIFVVFDRNYSTNFSKILIGEKVSLSL